jgi:hypothetical protein
MGETQSLWQKVWREGLMPLLSERALLVLKEALEQDDHELIQGHTALPEGEVTLDCPPEAACLLGYVAWKVEGRTTVGDIQSRFAEYCFEIDQRMGEPAACRYLLGFFDESPREEMRRAFLNEIELSLANEKEKNNG